MNKAQLKQLISEIVQRKLIESSGTKAAQEVDRICREEIIKEVRVNTVYGSYNLPITEVYENDRVLYITVDANPANEETQLQELVSGTADKTGEIGSMTSTAEKDPKVKAAQEAEKKALELKRKADEEAARIAQREMSKKIANQRATANANVRVGQAARKRAEAEATAAKNAQRAAKNIGA